MNQNKELNISLKLIIKSSFFVFLGVIFSKILTYIYRVIIARHFNPDIYGLFSLTVIVGLWFVSFSSLGLYEGLQRFIPLYRGGKELDKLNYISRFVIKILFISGIISGILLFLSSNFISINIFHNNDLIIFLKILSFIMPFYVLGYGFLFIIQAFEKIKIHPFISDFLPNFVKLIFLILFIFIGINTNSIIFSYSLGILSIFLAAYFYCKMKIPEIFTKEFIKKDLKKKIIKQLLSYSWPLIFLIILTNIFSYMDSLIIGFFRTTKEVGIYNAAVPIAELMIIIPTLMTRFFLPLITKEFAKKRLNIVKELSKQVEKWIFIINIPFCILLLFFPEFFINILFGKEYLLAKISLQFLSIAFLFSSLSVVLCLLINMIGKSKIILINTIIFSIINLFLNIILIPKYGINGAAFSTMISSILLTLILFIQIKKYFSFLPLKKKMIRIIFSIFISLILLSIISLGTSANKLTLILQGMFFILSYIILIFLTKSLDKNDFMIIKAIKQKIIK